MEEKFGNMWWLKAKNPIAQNETTKAVYNGGEYNISTNSLVDILEKEAESYKDKAETDVDVGSIIEEINRVAAQSPLGPFDSNAGERSVDELMKEAEKIYMESSKSFEQLSQRSKTSQNISEISLNSEESTPTPKGVSPLPLDPETEGNEKHSNENEVVAYSDDFSDENLNSSTDSTPSLETNIVPTKLNTSIKHSLSEKNITLSRVISQHNLSEVDINSGRSIGSGNKLVQSKSETKFDLNEKTEFEEQLEFERKKREIEVKQLMLKNNLIKALEEDNERLKNNIEDMKVELEHTQRALQESKHAAKARTPDLNVELEKTLDELKDTKEKNTALQLQLDSLTKTHVIMKNSQEDLINQNEKLERRFADIENSLSKYKHELLNVQKHRDKLLEVEMSLNKLLDIEKIQTKSLKTQNEADARCIQDLNRQIKEMERIIARKHPDSVSALIVAARGDATDSNLTARKLLEDRIKSLEEELQSKEKQSSQVFTEIQDKFNQMKLKYEHHIEDLELHVSDLKMQLKKRKDCFDMYTQTCSISERPQEIPEKESKTTAVQTDLMQFKPPKVIAVKSNAKVSDGKTESHLLATIRGLQADLSNKEKIIMKMQREIDEFKKTNRRLQKEREGSLKNIHERKDFRSYSERLSAKMKSDSTDSNVIESPKELADLNHSEFEKIKQQLCRIEMDYQNLKTKRLHDLNALQEAHEREMAQYIQNLQPLREQLEIQQLSINTLQTQLASAREELTIVTVERDHLNKQISSGEKTVICNKNIITDSNVESLQRKLAAAEKKYEDREHRLRAIVNALAQKNVMNRNCEQCAERQQQLIAYKMELDQILASVRALK